jgi:hypothetical protein
VRDPKVFLSFGSRTIARPIATRWRWPPESWRGWRSSSGIRPRMPAARSTLALICAAGALRRLSEKARFCATVMCG